MTKFEQAKIGAFDSELVREFFQAFDTHAAMTIHVETLYGENAHPIAESSFKGLARALHAARRPPNPESREQGSKIRHETAL